MRLHTGILRRYRQRRNQLTRWRRLLHRLDRWADRHPTVQVVQIGTHNGRTGDPLADILDTRMGWRAVLVEPTPDQFAALTAHRGGDSRIQLVRAAVTDHDGTVEMFTVEMNPRMPAHADQLSSIDRDTVLSHAWEMPGLEEALRTVVVPAVTWATLLASTEVGRVDVLHVDTEGHER